MQHPLGSEPSFDVSIVGVDDDCVVVFRGELDMTATDELWTCIELARRSGRPLTMDLAETTFMDSSGINLLLNAYRAHGQIAEAVTLRSPSDAVRTTLAMAGIGGLFRIDGQAAERAASAHGPP